MLTLIEAVASGKKFKRSGAADWFNFQATGNVFSAEDLREKDWVTEECRYRTEGITIAELEAIYVKINVAAPTMGRGTFRELVMELCGVVVK